MKKGNAFERMLDGAGLETAVEETAARCDTVTAAVLDLDHFSSVNAIAGREAGDRVLAVVAECLVQGARSEGWQVARTGGDEFAVLLADVSLEQGFLRMEKLRHELNTALAALQLPVECSVTPSIGVANWPRDVKKSGELVRKADTALYTAKEAGRDTVGLPPNEEMVLRSCYYTVAQLGRLRSLAERRKKKEAQLLREALDDLLRKYDV